MSAPCAVRFGPRSPIAAFVVAEIVRAIDGDDAPASNGPRAMRPEELAKVLGRLV